MSEQVKLPIWRCEFCSYSIEPTADGNYPGRERHLAAGPHPEDFQMQVGLNASGKTLSGEYICDGKTVGELITALQSFSPDTEILFTSDEYCVHEPSGLSFYFKIGSKSGKTRLDINVS